MLTEGKIFGNISSFEVKSAHPSEIKGLRRFCIWRIFGFTG